MLEDNNIFDIATEEDTPNYWMSYSDMMSGLLLMFILFLTISMLMFSETSEVLEVQKEQLKVQETKIEKIIGVRRQIIDRLKEQFDNSELQVNIDPQTGAITFSDGVFFDTGKYIIKDSGKEYLQRFIPQYIQVLLNNDTKQYISQIIIEGHTDSKGTYMNNLDLSQRRAFEVTKYILSEEFNMITDVQKKNLRDILTANGRSYSQLKKDNEGNELADKSRRVEFKFRLKDEEMIEEMNSILKGD